MTAHLLTGATGFIGGAIALELLDRTDADLYCLVRAHDPQLAEARLHRSLVEAARAYDRADLVGAIFERCRGVPGDIARPLQIAPPNDSISHVWHAAGCIKWDYVDAVEAELHNIIGTRNVADYAVRIQAAHFNHISTAYVAGKQTGTILETVPPAGAPTNNVYEASKLAAERLVLEAPLHVRVLRPSLVIGHSRTLAATTLEGIYGFVREYREFCAQVYQRLGNFLKMTSSNVLTQATNPINALPVDLVARNVVSIGLSDSAEQIFHLTNALAPTIGQAVRVLAQEFGVREPRFVSSRAELTLMDEALNGGLEAYASFALFDRSFDRAHTDAVCGRQASEFEFDDKRLSAYVSWYLQRLARADAQNAVAGV